MLWILRLEWVKEKTRAALGKNVYESIFDRAQQIAALPPPVPIFRIREGQIMGKRLEPGKEPPSVDPLMCQHPDSKVKPRANKTLKWWTCTLCQSRWLRIPLEEVEPQGTNFNDQDLVTFGNYMGQTYLAVYHDRHYAELIIRQAEMEQGASPALKRLAQYLVRKEQSQGWMEIPTPDLDSELI